MKKMAIIAVAVCVMACGAGKASAASGSIEVPVVSGYLFRGLLLNDETVLQPLAMIAAENGFALYAWANMPMTDQNMFGNDDPGDFSEVDLIVEYTPPFGGDMGTITFGCAQYLYPDPTYSIPASPEAGMNAAPTREVYTILALSAPLSPTLSLYFDADAYDGAFYGNFKLSHDFVMNKLTVGANASIGYGNEYYQRAYLGYADSAWNDLNFGVSASYAVKESISLSIKAVYSVLMNSNVEDTAEIVWMNDGDTVTGSAGVSFMF